MKNIFFLFTVLGLISCSGNNNPVVPPNPVPVPPVPEADIPHEHSTGFIFKSGGLMQGAAFAVPPAPVGMPVSFDWVKEGYETPVRNQGNCGSCWAFGSTQMLDNAVKIFDNKDSILSEQEIVAYDNNSGGCAGGYFAGAFMVKNGLVLDSKCPYTASNRGCPGGMPSTFDAKPTAWLNIGDGNRSPTPQELMSAILNYGPIAVDVAATANWDSYAGGVKKSCGGTRINHIVTLVGFNAAQKTWRMKNSWGVNWGDKGYADMPWGCDSIASDASALVYKPGVMAFKPHPSR